MDQKWHAVWFDFWALFANLNFLNVIAWSIVQCYHSCTRATQLKVHMLTHSGKNRSLVHCALCNYSGTTAGDLKQHLLIQSGKKPFNCKQCNYSCTTASHLPRHMQIHSGVKPFSCIQLGGGTKYEC